MFKIKVLGRKMYAKFFTIVNFPIPPTYDKAKVGARGCHVNLHYLNTLQNQVLGQSNQ